MSNHKRHSWSSKGETFVEFPFTSNRTLLTLLLPKVGKSNIFVIIIVQGWPHVPTQPAPLAPKVSWYWIGTWGDDPTWNEITPLSQGHVCCSNPFVLPTTSKPSFTLALPSFYPHTSKPSTFFGTLVVTVLSLRLHFCQPLAFRYPITNFEYSCDPF